MVLLLVTGGAAHATSYSHRPTVDEALAASSVAVHGIVRGTSSCVGSRAWTFVDLEVGEVIRGQLEAEGFASFSSGESLSISPVDEEEQDSTCDPGPVEWVWDDPLAVALDDDGLTPAGPELVAGGCSVDVDWAESTTEGFASMAAGSNILTFRVPAGAYPDGTFGTILDTPSFKVNDEVVVFLTYEPDGDHVFIPFSWMGWSVYRVFRGTGGQTAVVDGFGSTLHVRSDGVPVRGYGARALRALYYQDPPIDGTAAGAALNAIASEATWNGTGRAQGPWRGKLRAEVTGDADSSCLANLAGIVTNTTLSLVGRCNAALAGATDVEVDGTYSAGHWTGEVTFTPRGLPTESRSVSWSSATDSPDRLTGSATGNHAESGYTFAYDIDLRAGFVGPRPLMSFASFRTYLLNRAAVHADSAGIGHSIELGPASCNQTIPFAAQE